MQASDVINLHQSKCPLGNTSLQLSADGVSEARSNLNSMDVYSTRFKNCRVVYPHVLVRPLGKYRMDNRKILSDLVNDILVNDGVIENFVGDNPKRSNAKNSLSHSSLHPCEYCFKKGTSFNVCDPSLQAKIEELREQSEAITAQINECTSPDRMNTLTNIIDTLQSQIRELSKKRSQIVWPASSFGGEPRTREKIMEIVQKIENNERLDRDEAKGVMGNSPLLHVPGFDFVIDTPAEYLHSSCLGVTKRMIECTFNVGENRTRNTKRKLSDPSKFNSLMSKVKVVRESSRRARTLDFSVLKGQEFRNISIFFFPIVIECIDVGQKERKLWLLYAFMIRACVITNEEYEKIDKNLLRNCCQMFYILYESLFSVRNCTYNTHVLASHLPEIRAHGPLTLTSAFGFENFYGELRNSFCPGTRSPLKQILEKVLLKRAISSHCCQETIYYSPNDTCLECNSLVYQYAEGDYNFFKVIHVDTDTISCVKIGKYVANYPETPNLPWNRVGVFRAGGETDENVVLSKNEISGKLFRVQNFLITCPNNVLREK